MAAKNVNIFTQKEGKVKGFFTTEFTVKRSQFGAGERLLKYKIDFGRIISSGN